MKMKQGDFMDMSHIEEKVVGNSRWHVVHEAIAEIEGKFYRGKYRVGATEYQETDFDDEINLTEVHQVEKMQKVWEPVEPDQQAA